MRTAAFAAMLLLAWSSPSAADTAPPGIEWNCGAQLKAPEGTFTGQAYSLWWDETLSDQTSIHLRYGVWLDPGESESLRLFGGLNDMSELTIGWYNRHWSMNAPARTAELRVGDTSVRAPLRFNAQSADFFLAGAHGLFSSAGDLVLILYDHRGRELQRSTISRDTLAAAEQHFHELNDQIRANVLDRDHHCRLDEIEEVIVD